MSWMELSLDTTDEAVDWVCTLLAGTAYTNDVRITKYQRSSYGESAQFPVESATGSDRSDGSDWTASVCIYLPNDARAQFCMSDIMQVLLPLQRTGQSTPLQMAVVEEKAAYGDSPLIHRVGQRFVILSPDVPYQALSDDIPLRLGIGLAFGSGLHPATMLSLQLLERHVMPGMTTLDLGSGSGILSVAMAKLGAHVLAVDNDPIAVQVSQDTVRRNDVAAQVQVMEGSLGQGSDLGHWMGGELLNPVPMISSTAQFDLVVANILARIHIALAPDFRRSLRQTHANGGLLITAGFTTDYEADVTAALGAAGFETIDHARLNEWVALVHRLKD